MLASFHGKMRVNTQWNTISRFHKVSHKGPSRLGLWGVFKRAVGNSSYKNTVEIIGAFLADLVTSKICSSVKVMVILQLFKVSEILLNQTICCGDYSI